MGTPRNTTKPSLLFPAVYCLVILGLGLWLSLATGQWLIMVCAAGLLVVPVRTYSGRRKDRTRNA